MPNITAGPGGCHRILTASAVSPEPDETGCSDGRNHHRYLNMCFSLSYSSACFSLIAVLVVFAAEELLLSPADVISYLCVHDPSRQHRRHRLVLLKCILVKPFIDFLIDGERDHLTLCFFDHYFFSLCMQLYNAYIDFI